MEWLPSSVAGRILEHIESLAKAPRPRGVVKLQGGKGLWRMRVGDYRVIYGIDDTARNVDVSAVRNRRDAYRDL